jgi:hypothetical protein
MNRFAWLENVYPRNERLYNRAMWSGATLDEMKHEFDTQLERNLL